MVMVEFVFHLYLKGYSQMASILTNLTVPVTGKMYHASSSLHCLLPNSGRTFHQTVIACCKQFLINRSNANQANLWPFDAKKVSECWRNLCPVAKLSEFQLDICYKPLITLFALTSKSINQLINTIYRLRKIQPWIWIYETSYIELQMNLYDVSYIHIHLFILHGYITNSQYDQLPELAC